MAKSRGGRDLSDDSKNTNLRWEPNDLTRLAQIEAGLRHKLGVDVSRVMAIRIAIKHYADAIIQELGMEAIENQMKGETEYDPAEDAAM